jgi:hypothetical protein
MLALMWILQLFPATPKLGPIYQNVTHMVALSFPVLIIVPAVCIDVVMHRFDGRVSTPVLAAIIGPVFVASFVAAQWPFASFLVYSPLARGRLFNAENFVYWMSPVYEASTRRFPPPGDWPIASHLLLAAALATMTSLIGLARGSWMRKVRR